MTSVARQLVALSKPRIVALLVLTGLCGVWKAADGSPAIQTLVLVALGGGLAAAGSNAVNQGLDADIDAVMRRTRRRPVPSRAMSSRAAVVVGVASVLVGVAALGVGVNWLSAGLTALASAVYVFVYTVALKRRSWNNIVIGGASGAFPPLIGAAAVTGQIEVVGLYMFALVFFWTPPHFWTLSIMLKDDYSAAQVPMLPTITTPQATSLQIVLYIALLLGLTWLPVAAGYAGLIYATAGSVAGLYWLAKTLPLLRSSVSYRQTLAAYKFSLLYLAVLFVVFAAEPSLPWAPAAS